MNRGRLPRAIPVILVIVITVVAIGAVTSIGRSIFGGPSEDPTDPGQTALLNTTTTYNVTMTVRGPIVADEEFYSYRITASSDERNLTTYQGYLGTEVASMTYPNNVRAYEEFVHALSRARLMEGNVPEGEANDVRGICARKNLYEFEVRRGRTVIKKLWTSDCKGSQGSLEADVKQVGDLFRAQIPDSRTLIREVGLR